MQKILADIQKVYGALVAKEAQASRILSDVESREAAVKKRETACAEYESAKAVLDAVAKTRQEIAAEGERLKEEKVKFENLIREEKQAIANEQARLAPLKDLEKQLAKEKADLEIEKRTFKERYIEKIKQHFLNTKGAPTPDEIS